MPWCEPCSRFYNPNSLRADGSCPSCGRKLAAGDGSDTSAAATKTSTTASRTKVPWHFWLLIAAVAIYLGWRALQGVGWLVDLF